MKRAIIKLKKKPEQFEEKLKINFKPKEMKKYHICCIAKVDGNVRKNLLNSKNE